ncbi:MAG TPA: Uma2 family endonuclease [Isosphaeraceae bacterium]|jgi:Uma2 family endonuclease
MATATAQALLTAEEYGRRPDPGTPEELVRGRIVRMPQPKPRHGQIRARAARILGNHADDHDLGHVLSNDAGVITQRDPDTVRGADVAFYSFARVPKGPLPTEYLDVAPELVIEVRSPSDRWPAVLAKVAEYLDAGVLVVGVLDDESRTAHLFYADRPGRILGPDDELGLPDLLGDVRVPIRRFFQ